MVAPLLIGIDEGTTAVKAVLYDEKLTPLREARRRKRRHRTAKNTSVSLQTREEQAAA